MTSRDGYSRDMSRFVPDARSVERLVAGSVDSADAPALRRAVAVRLQALRDPPETCELAGERDAVEQIAAVVLLERQYRRAQQARRSSSRVAVLAATALVVCALPLTGGLASAGALPEPAQNVASRVLDKVGISVPTGAHDSGGEAPPPPTSAPPPPTTTGPVPDVGGPPAGAGAPVADVAPRPGLPSPAPPGNGEADHGTRGRGEHRNDDDGRGKDGGEDGRGSQGGKNGREGGDGNGHDR